MELLDNLDSEDRTDNTSAILSFSIGNLILKDSLLFDYLSTTHASRNDVDFYETTIESCIKNIEENVSEFGIIVIDDFQKTLLTSRSARMGLECIELDEGYPYYHLHRNHSLANQDEIRIDSLMHFPFVQLKTDEYTALRYEKLKEEYPDISVRRCIVVNHYPSYLSIIKNSDAFAIGNKWQISELEKMGIQSIRFSSFNHKVHLMIIKKELLPLSTQAKRFIHLFKDSYGLDGA